MAAARHDYKFSDVWEVQTDKGKPGVPRWKYQKFKTVTDVSFTRSMVTGHPALDGAPYAALPTVHAIPGTLLETKAAGPASKPRTLVTWQTWYVLVRAVGSMGHTSIVARLATAVQLRHSARDEHATDTYGQYHHHTN